MKKVLLLTDDRSLACEIEAIQSDIEADEIRRGNKYKPDFFIYCLSSLEVAAAWEWAEAIIIPVSMFEQEQVKKFKTHKIYLYNSGKGDFPFPSIGRIKCAAEAFEKIKKILNGTFDFSKTETEYKLSAMDLVPGLFQYLSDAGYSITEKSMEEFTYLAGNTEGIMDAEMAENILRPLIVKNQKQDETIHKDVKDYFHTIQIPLTDPEMEKRKNKHADAKKNLDTAKQKKDEAYKKYQAAADDNLPSYITEKEYKKKTGDKLAKDYRDLVNKYAKKNKQFLLELPERAAGKKDYTVKEAEEAEEELKTLMKKAMLHPQAKKMIDYLMDNIKISKKMANKIPSKKEQLFQEYKQLEKQEKAQEKAVEDAYKNMVKYHEDQLKKQIEKQETLKHRPEFTDGKNTVKAKYNDEPTWMDKEFAKLTQSEKQQIQEYIRQNAKEFRTRMSGYIRVRAKREIDFADTCKKACQTGGIPIRLSYVKPSFRKTNVLLILDISGSCKEASELMITFMYYMRECFPGGCLTYVFINSLYDVTKIMADANSPGEAVSTILSLVPRSGAYSNYYSTLQQFYRTQMPKITAKSTYAFFIGDARNNKNPSGEEYIKAISRKTRKTCWLNTDKIEKWGQGDSIIQLYEPYMDSTVMVRTPGELFHLLQHLERVR